jgi:photosystem II stability/assembly factor-like uncharacterized protein
MIKPARKVFGIPLLAGALLLWMPLEWTLAHSPHHVITDVAAAPAGPESGDVFILITDQLFRSDRNGAVWKNLVNGLNNQYLFTAIVISPDYELDNTIFVSTAGDGVYRSRDRGNSWQPVNTGLERLDISTMTLSADDAGGYSVLAASSSGGVWQFGNNDRWELVLTEVVQVTSISATSIAGNQSFVHAGDSTGTLWRSSDGGRLWGLSHEFPAGSAVTSVASHGETVLAGVQDSGLYRSTDGGMSFEIVDSLHSTRHRDCHGSTIDDPLADKHITSISMSPPTAETQRVFVTTWYDGVFVSDDMGTTWTQWDDGLTCDVQADDMSEAHFRRFAIDVAESGEPIYWLGAFDGLFRGEGPAPSWQQMETLPLGLIKGMAVAQGSDDLAIALATYGGGFYLTDDRGSNWTIGNKGLQTTRLTGLVFSPDYAEDGIIYAGASRRLLRSSDRGQSWQRIDLRITSFGRSVRNKLRGWGIPTGWLGSDNFAQVYPTMLVMSDDDDGKVRFATRFHGIMGYEHASGDVVSLWPETTENINTFEISPDFSIDSTLFASIRGQGLIRSDDGGSHWNAINNGLDFIEQWKTNPEGANLRRDVLVAISPNFAEDQLVFAGSPAGDGLFVSYDRGAVWSRMAIDIGNAPAPILAISISPDFVVDKTLMLSVRGHGIFRSTDGGQSFQSIGSDLIADNASIELLAISPAYSEDHAVIAASDEQLFISEDSGESWSAKHRPVRYEDMREVVRFTGETRRKQGENYSALTETRIIGERSAVGMHFVGSGIRVLGSRDSECGSANVYLDGRLAGPIDCKADQAESMQTIFEISGLTFGSHELEVRIESGSADQFVDIDAFDVLGTGGR